MISLTFLGKLALAAGMLPGLLERSAPPAQEQVVAPADVFVIDDPPAKPPTAATPAAPLVAARFAPEPPPAEVPPGAPAAQAPEEYYTESQPIDEPAEALSPEEYVMEEPPVEWRDGDSPDHEATAAGEVVYVYVDDPYPVYIDAPYPAYVGPTYYRDCPPYDYEPHYPSRSYCPPVYARHYPFYEPCPPIDDSCPDVVVGINTDHGAVYFRGGGSYRDYPSPRRHAATRRPAVVPAQRNDRVILRDSTGRTTYRNDQVRRTPHTTARAESSGSAQRGERSPRGRDAGNGTRVIQRGRDTSGSGASSARTSPAHSTGRRTLSLPTVGSPDGRTFEAGQNSARTVRSFNSAARSGGAIPNGTGGFNVQRSSGGGGARSSSFLRPSGGRVIQRSSPGRSRP